MEVHLQQQETQERTSTLSGLWLEMVFSFQREGEAWVGHCKAEVSVGRRPRTVDSSKTRNEGHLRRTNVLPIEGRALKAPLESNQLTVDSIRSLYLRMDHRRGRIRFRERME